MHFAEVSWTRARSRPDDGQRKGWVGEAHTRATVVDTGASSRRTNFSAIVAHGGKRVSVPG